VLRSRPQHIDVDRWAARCRLREEAIHAQPGQVVLLTAFDTPNQLQPARLAA